MATSARPSPGTSSYSPHMTEDKLLRIYSTSKGWRTRKITTMKHMIQKVDMQFNVSSYSKLKKVMAVFEKQNVNMCEIYEQLISMHSDLAEDHNKESLEFEQEFQLMVHPSNVQSFIWKEAYRSYHRPVTLTDTLSSNQKLFCSAAFTTRSPSDSAESQLTLQDSWKMLQMFKGWLLQAGLQDQRIHEM